MQKCPFEDEAGQPCKGLTYAFADLCIENLRYGERSALRRIHSLFRRPEIKFPGLAIHLIRDHHFFEGSVPYRLDLERAVAVLEIEAGVDYAPRRASEATWRFRSGTRRPYELMEPKLQGFLGRSMDEPDEVVEVAEGIRIYVKGDECCVIADHDHPLGAPLVVRGAEWAAPVIRSGTYVYVRIEKHYVVP